MNRRSMAPIGLAAIAVGLGVWHVVAVGSRTGPWVAVALGAVTAAAVVTAAMTGAPAGRVTGATDAPSEGRASDDQASQGRTSEGQTSESRASEDQARCRARRWSWSMLAVVIAGWTAGAVVGSYERSTDAPSSPGLVQAAVALAVPWMMMCVLGIASGRSPARPRTPMSERIVAGLSASAVLWLLFVEPYVSGRSGVAAPRTWTIALVAVHVLLAAIVARRAVIAPAQRWPLAATAAAFASAALALVIVEQRLGGAASWLLVAPVLVAVGSASLGSTRVTSPANGVTADPLRPVKRYRVIALAVIASMPLATLAAIVLVADTDVSAGSIVVVTAISIVVMLLVVIQIWTMVLYVRDVTERQGQARLAALVEHSNDVVMIVDEAGTVSYVSPGLAGAFGHEPGELLGGNLVDVVAEEDRAMAVERFRAFVAVDRDRTTEFEAVLVRSDGRRRNGSVVLVNLLGDEAVAGVVATFRDITEQRDLERQLSHRAFHDELTGLANRALFLDRMDHALRTTRNDREPVMVLFIDLDDFKGVNDIHGHGMGDEVLSSIAERIRSTARSGDTIARLGGDEFAVLLEDRSGIDQAIELAERLLAVLRDPVSVAGLDVVVLASIGIAAAMPGTNTTNLLRDADIAMYEAKRAGKGQLRIFDPAMRRVASRHLAYRSELANAVTKGQLRVVYLPYVDLTTGRARGAEALVRWLHPGHGEISPAEFVPIAERTGLIVPIGRWVIGEALDQAAVWEPSAELFVSVNLTGVELRQPDLLEFLLHAVISRKLHPSILMIEVTEPDLVDDGDQTVRAVAELREHGFGVALDDFGAGYCSVSFLQRHPVDMIKIDSAFVAELEHRPDGTSLAHAILHLTQSLGMISAAEGIENVAQMRELRQRGCSLGQGHLLSAPLEAPELARRFGRTGTAAEYGAPS